MVAPPFEDAGVLNLVAPNVLIHLRLDERPAKLSPIECCLTAALCDAGAAVASKLVAGSTRELCRWLELRLGTTVLEMAASRLKRALAKTGVTDTAGPAFDVEVAQDRIGEGFRLSGVGPASASRAPIPTRLAPKSESSREERGSKDVPPWCLRTATTLMNATLSSDAIT